MAARAILGPSLSLYSYMFLTLSLTHTRALYIGDRTFETFPSRKIKRHETTSQRNVLLFHFWLLVLLKMNCSQVERQCNQQQHKHHQQRAGEGERETSHVQRVDDRSDQGGRRGRFCDARVAKVRIGKNSIGFGGVRIICGLWLLQKSSSSVMDQHARPPEHGRGHNLCHHQDAEGSHESGATGASRNSKRRAKAG
jgi:hypothetical protein